MMQKDIALGLLAAIVTIEGLILIFCGFLFTKAESYETKRGKKFKLMAKLGVLPLIASFLSSWVCIMAIQDNPWAVLNGVIAIVISAIYSIIALLSL